MTGPTIRPLGCPVASTGCWQKPRGFGGVVGFAGGTQRRPSPRRRPFGGLE